MDAFTFSRSSFVRPRARSCPSELAAIARGKTEIVALVVDWTEQQVAELAEALKPDWFQFHGREAPEQTLLVALNFFGWAVDLRLDGPLPANHWKLRYSTASTDVPRIMGNRMRLQPFEAVILEPV